MRNFPVQDYIPVQEENHHQQDHEGSSTSRDSMPIARKTAAPLETNGPLTCLDQVANDSLVSSEDTPTRDYGPEQEVPTAEEEDDDPPAVEAAAAPEPTISSIASAVLSLPTFSSDGFLKRHASKPKAASTANASRKKSSARKGKSGGAASPSLKLISTAEVSAFKQDEWLLTYPSTTVTAVHVRSDGSAIAKWPNGSIAVSVDRERDGFRIYAAHKDGQIALSFDSVGVGFINYYPSGKMMISTTSSGDGLYFSSDGFSILRQWDAHLNLKDEHSDPTDVLGSEADGSLLCKLSDGVGVRIQLADTSAWSTATADLGAKTTTTSPILMTVYFATTSGIRYKFVNSINRSPVGAATTSGQQSDACDCVFGKQQPPAPKREEDKPPPIPHADLLHDIRAAVASLQQL